MSRKFIKVLYKLNNNFYSAHTRFDIAITYFPQAGNVAKPIITKTKLFIYEYLYEKQTLYMYDDLAFVAWFIEPKNPQVINFDIGNRFSFKTMLDFWDGVKRSNFDIPAKSWVCDSFKFIKEISFKELLR